MKTRNELELAELVKEIVEQFNFKTKTAPNSVKEKGQKLYRKIFFDKGYDPKKVPHNEVPFRQEIYSKVMTCSGCCKQVFEALRTFYQKIID